MQKNPLTIPQVKLPTLLPDGALFFGRNVFWFLHGSKFDCMSTHRQKQNKSTPQNYETRKKKLE